MKSVLIAIVAVFALGLFAISTKAADEGHTMTGVLMDNACGSKDSMKTEEDAAKHPISCDKKPACAASGYQLVVGDKHYKLDDKGNDEAKKYFENADSSKVTIDGTMDGDTLKVNSIKPAEEKKS